MIASISLWSAHVHPFRAVIFTFVTLMLLRDGFWDKRKAARVLRYRYSSAMSIGDTKTPRAT